jgi:putative transposase
MNKYDPTIHHRKSIRMEGYDYSQEGLYFITLCTQNHKCLLGDISDSILTTNNAGKMIEREWLSLPIRFPNIQLHEFIVMPNHFHAILEISTDENHPNTINHTSLKNASIINIIDAFKSITTVKYIHGVKNDGWTRFEEKLWQFSYWDHIIRKIESYQEIANYIITNPSKWSEDLFHTQSH